MKIQHEGEEIEVYTAAEAQAMVATKETEFGVKMTEKEQELADAKKALGERAGEFAQFRKLNDDTIAKLSVAEKTIYENGLALHEEREKNKVAEQGRVTAARDASLRAKAGTDDKLFDEMKKMWDVVQINATTPEEIENKTNMVLGALGMSQPDLVAAVQGFSGGSYTPPKVNTDEPSFADSERGKKAAEELGLKL